MVEFAEMMDMTRIDITALDAALPD